MSVNRYQPHVLVLPEDDANRQLANGFLLDQSFRLARSRCSRKRVDGERCWTASSQITSSEWIAYPDRFMVLLIDFDGQEERLTEAKNVYSRPPDDRVFILGVRTEPEELRRASLGSYETIGLALAKDCREETETTWEP